MNSEFYQNLKSRIEARIPLVYIETSEWEQLENCLSQIVKDSDNLECLFWNPVQGLTPFREEQENKGDEEAKSLRLLVSHLINMFGEESERRSITVIEYAERWKRDPDAAIQLGVMARELTRQGGGKHQVILASPALAIPSIIQREVDTLESSLPKKDDIKRELNKMGEKFGVKVDTASPILDAVRGLGTTEIRNAFAKTIENRKKITSEEIPYLVSEKEQIIRKSGYLEFVKTSSSMQDIGGLRHLKDWLQKRELAFRSKSKTNLLDAPKGALLLGIPGTGKSLSAKVVAATWKMPLLRLDMGKIFGGLVGESEANMRNAIKTAESAAPCVLWIDEIEKGLGSSGGERDGGTSARVFGSFLTWMQEKKEEVFVFATANNVSQLPPEMLRKGRFDEIFFVDLPGEEARRAIFKIHLENKKQDAKLVTDEIIKDTEGFSGAEIEAVVKDAFFVACHENNGGDPKITTKMLCDEIKGAIPLSSTMEERIKELRAWAESRSRLANDEAPPSLGKKRAKIQEKK